MIVATKPDIQVLRAACNHGARGSFLENVSGALLLMTLQYTENTLIGPEVTQWLVEHFSESTLQPLPDVVLTSRERDVFNLLRQGYTNDEMSTALCIT